VAGGGVVAGVDVVVEVDVLGEEAAGTRRMRPRWTRRRSRRRWQS
jgi:hypothetical protein